MIMPEIIKIYDENDTRRLKGNFKDPSTDADSDPSGVTFRIILPDNTVITYVYNTDSELVKESTGNYYVQYKFTQSGDYYYSFEGTGAVYPGNKEKRIKVKDSRITD